jgi:diguanylate cyclase (GGDEF)-like protein
MSIRTKIITITTAIIFFAIGAIVLVSNRHFIKIYTQILQSRSLAVGKSLKLQLDRLLQLGIQLENLTGFDEQCHEVATKYEGIEYAMVVETESGRVLFHNNPSEVNRTLQGTALLEGVKSSKEVVVRSFSDHGHEHYTAIVPVFDRESGHVAAVGIGFGTDIIDARARKAALFSISVGLLFLSGAVASLFAILSALVTNPLTKLLAVIQEMRDKKQVSTRKVDISSGDEIGQVAMAFNDMTESLRKATVTKEAFEHQATHDTLTGLPNRSLLSDRLEQTIRMAHRHRNQAAVLFLDLDNFKVINDSLGHDIGDQLLKTIAGRLTDAVRSSDTVSRQAGDEFVIILSDLTEPENAAKVAGKIIERVSAPLVLGGHDVSMTCSIGISIYPKDGDDVSTLLKNADTALYRAKEHGKNGFQFFTAEMNTRLYERMEMEHQLRLALEREEFILYYQPKVSLHTGRIVGMEALIRWHHPERGLVGPGKFIALAEETGLIEPIGEWVLKATCGQVKAWRQKELPRLPVAINISARQFRHNALAKLVKSAVNNSGLEPTDIEIEVTESLLMLNTESVQAILKELKDFGIGLILDDFGTGYSSLSYLKRFPFDKLKLDISFVRNITSEPDSAAISLAIIAMAHALNLKVIAEGVETEGQMRYMYRHGCDEMQGYYYSRPLPASDFKRLVLEDRCLSLPSNTAEAPDNTILLVDDDIRVLSALKRMLGTNGYRILTATDTEEAFELLARNRVGLVVADHYMPGMNGTEFLARIRSLHPGCVRIALTGSANLDIVMDAVNQGAIFKFITKPWQDEQLKETVHEALQHYRRQNVDKG